MKTITTLALLTGVAFAVPSFAHEVEHEARGMDVSQSEKLDPKHEAFKKFVSDALDAHKGKASKDMKGHHEDMKAYVGKALDAHALAQQKLLNDISDWSVQQGIEYLFDHAIGNLRPKLDAANCFALNYEEMTECVNDVIDTQRGDDPHTYENDFIPILETFCTGDHWWIPGRGNCSIGNIKEACRIVGQAGIGENKQWIANCMADCTEPDPKNCP